MNAFKITFIEIKNKLEYTVDQQEKRRLEQHYKLLRSNMS